MYKKYKCLNIKKELLPTLPVTNFESGLKEEALKKKEASKKAEERNKCCMKQWVEWLKLQIFSKEL